MQTVRRTACLCRLVNRQSKGLGGQDHCSECLGPNVENLMLRRYLRQVKVDPSSVTVIQIAFPQIAAALKARDVDAASLIEPYLSAALREKAGSARTPLRRHQ
jgi:hypothetical protein